MTATSKAIEAAVELNDEIQNFERKRGAEKTARFLVVVSTAWRLLLAGFLFRAFELIPSRKLGVLVLDASFMLGLGAAIVCALVTPILDWGEWFERRPITLRLFWLVVLLLSLAKLREPISGAAVEDWSVAPLAHVGYSPAVLTAAWGLIRCKSSRLRAGCISTTNLCSIWCISYRAGEFVFFVFHGSGCRVFDLSMACSLPASYILLAAGVWCHSLRHRRAGESYKGHWSFTSVFLWLSHTHMYGGVKYVMAGVIMWHDAECLSVERHKWYYLAFVDGLTAFVPHFALLISGTGRVHRFFTRWISPVFEDPEELAGFAGRLAMCSTFLLSLEHFYVALGEHEHMFQYSNRVLARLVSVSGTVILSTCPPGAVDLDTLLAERPNLRAGMGLTVLMYCGLNVAFTTAYLYAVPALIMLQFGLAAKLQGATCGRVTPRPVNSLCAAAVSKLLADASYLRYGGSGCRPFDVPVALAFASVGVSLMLGLFWLHWLRLRDHGIQSLPPTTCFYVCTYCLLTLWGVQQVGHGASWFAGCPARPQDDKGAGLALSTLLNGVADLTPIVIVLAIGRRRLFNLTARRFDRDRAQRDGAFLARLLDSASRVQVGDPFWIHHGRNDEKYPLFDTRRNWEVGEVVSVSSDSFVVCTGEPRSKSLSRRGSARSSQASLQAVIRKVSTSMSRNSSDPGIRHMLPMAAREMTAEDMLALAQRELRCIDWNNISQELMESSKGDPDVLHALARRLRPGEVIDYFMSHSWHDGVGAKWDKLKQVVEEFERRCGRSPTFWLDKVCIDQRNIADGLKVLPVNVMACRQVLVLCGPTYPERLWCVWELCVLFSFISPEQAWERLRFEVLDKGSDSGVLERLREFQVKHACCYDPNEQAKLLQVIGTIGTDRFDAQIRKLAEAIQMKLRSSSPCSPMLSKVTRLGAFQAVSLGASSMPQDVAMEGTVVSI
eukprot:TRINITY_DN10777_c0_g4_i1.p1 TRINITY_DN10777_c0_g4~~TRINITY_DN10777_c0_g4_i1.p1  ORF type:complete len:949 (+),score=75.53 TRINITY_DN10777_c0_g4_i1:117-2963(+)